MTAYLISRGGDIEALVIPCFFFSPARPHPFSIVLAPASHAHVPPATVTLVIISLLAFKSIILSSLACP